MAISFPRLKPEVYVFDRRQFFKAAGAAGAGVVGAAMLDPQKAIAQGMAMCEKVVDIRGAASVSNAPEHLYYFIDGRHMEVSLTDQLSNLKSRANLTLFIDLVQRSDRYVETVILVGPTGETLGARYFDSTDKISTGQPPYVCFENIELEHKKKYEVYYQIRESATVVKLYRYVLENAKRTTLDASLAYLPDTMVSDFGLYQANVPGLMTSPYQFYTQNQVSVHTARGRIQDIGSDNSFAIELDAMHANQNTTHYMRYFLATDPVGRILGVRKEGYVASTSQDMKITVNELSDTTASTVWAMDTKTVAKINDCPFIRIYTEDVYDAIASSIVRLR